MKRQRSVYPKYLCPNESPTKLSLTCCSLCSISSERAIASFTLALPCDASALVPSSPSFFWSMAPRAACASSRALRWSSSSALREPSRCSSVCLCSFSCRAAMVSRDFLAPRRSSASSSVSSSTRRWAPSAAAVAAAVARSPSSSALESSSSFAFA